MNVNYKKSLLAMTLFSILGFQQNAYAALVGFEDFSASLGMGSDNTITVGPGENADLYPVVSQGYEFTVGPQNESIGFNDLHVNNSVIGSYSGGGFTDYIYAYNGPDNTVLSAHYDVTMERADGVLFDLYSFQFSGVNENSTVREGDITVTGIFGDNTTISQTFESDFFADGLTAGPVDILDFETFYMGEEGWYGLKSITFTHIDSVNSTMLAGVFAIDNIQVSAVPVPAAVWLFGSGLLGLVGVARRKEPKQ